MTAQEIYEKYNGSRNVNSSRKMLKLLIYRTKFCGFSTAFTKYPTIAAHN